MRPCMVMLRRPRLISAVFLLLVLQLGSVLCSSSSCCGDQQQHGGAMRMAGRRLLIGHQVLAKGLMEHAKKQEALLDEQKREIITGPNPLHNR
ncbi:hypothetical protein GUJ93_ZPchr0013g35736 [Zizania palustris]|uniref:Uncharacterized protein n=1 Tax=Zizania palustris TaxID=103762 RepID=A0A8J5WYF9_ZIZPA|nr:hypothetical protein GUJ93_ZPchr0013g35736 [Zizania palustris]